MRARAQLCVRPAPAEIGFPPRSEPFAFIRDKTEPDPTVRAPTLLLTGAGLVVACGSEPQAPDPGPTAPIRKIHGDNERVDPGAAPTRLSIQITDAAGIPVPAVPVALEFQTGDGGLEPDAGQTDLGGKSSTSVRVSANTLTTSGRVDIGVRVVSDERLHATFWLFVGDDALAPQHAQPDGEGSFRGIVADSGSYSYICLDHMTSEPPAT
ncbi:MAG TPA: Ig-like domain-containing protein [Gemmatimonadales bacterium]